MKRWYIFPQLVVAMVMIATFTYCHNPLKQERTSAVTHPNVLLELFTSQGCSSCPPADALLGTYAGKGVEKVLALAFHVDYWDRLGWKDPFSSNAFSARQRNYSRQLKLDGVYTPQAVINGQTETVGNNRSKLTEQVAAAERKANNSLIDIDHLAVRPNGIDFEVSHKAGGAGAVINAALVQRKVVTAIRSGENSGVTLTNFNVVREMQTLPVTNMNSSMHLSLPQSFRREDYFLAVFTQDKDLRVTAIAVSSL